MFSGFTLKKRRASGQDEGTDATPTTAANTPAHASASSTAKGEEDESAKNQTSEAPEKKADDKAAPACEKTSKKNGHQPQCPCCKAPPKEVQPMAGESRCSPSYLRRKFFPWKILPWWALMIAMVYSLQRIKFLYHESACSVLGINDSQGGITMSSLKKAFRNSSMCTHPDRLRGRLKRMPTKEEEHRGQVLFNRYSNARDSLQEEIQRKQARKERKIERKLRLVNADRKKRRLPPVDVEDYIVEQREKLSAERKEAAEEEESLRAEGGEAAVQAASFNATSLIMRSRQRDNIFDDKPVHIYCEDLEYGFGAMWRDAKDMFGATKPEDIWLFCKEFAYTICTFEAGFMNTIGLCITLLFLYKAIRQLFSWFWSCGLNAPLYAIGAVTVQPIPTVLYFFALPLLRVYVFVQQELKPFLVENFQTGAAALDNAAARPTEDAELQDTPRDDGDATPTRGGAAQKAKTSPRSTAGIKVVSEEALNKNLRKRRAVQRKERDIAEAVSQLDVDGEAKSEAEDDEGGLLGAGPAKRAASGEQPAPTPRNFGEETETRENLSLWSKITLTSSQPNKARMQVAAATQFDLLLPLTKPVFPLLMLLTTGQVWSGLIPAVFSSHILRNWVPRLNYETHHLIAFLFGFMHTILGLSAAQVEQHADAEQISGILLKWEWGMKDMVSILNMILIGAFVASLSQLGNEPQFCCSFASGLSFRILSRNISEYRDFIPFYGDIVGYGMGVSNSLGIVMDQVDDLFAMAGGGIGDCTGGFYRSMASGDEARANTLALVVKCFLIVLPALSCGQWLLRCYKGSQAVNRGSDRRQRRHRWFRVLVRGFMGLQGLAQVGLLWTFDLNASHGGLINFWLAFLLGAVFESLLGMDDIRGMFRQVAIMIIFIFS